MIQSHLRSIARQSFLNSMLPNPSFPSSEVQKIWSELEGKDVVESRERGDEEEDEGD